MADATLESPTEITKVSRTDLDTAPPSEPPASEPPARGSGKKTVEFTKSSKDRSPRSKEGSGKAESVSIRAHSFSSPMWLSFKPKTRKSSKDSASGDFRGSTASNNPQRFSSYTATQRTDRWPSQSAQLADASLLSRLFCRSVAPPRLPPSVTTAPRLDLRYPQHSPAPLSWVTDLRTNFDARCCGRAAL